MKKPILLTCLLSLLSPLPARAAPARPEGREIGNGGEPAALEFGQALREALAELHAKREHFSSLPLEALEALAAKASVFVVRHRLVVESGGLEQESAAVNYPLTNRILLNAYRWEEIGSASLRRALALHELLGLAGLEGTGDYRHSRTLLRLAGQSCEGPGLCLDFPRDRSFSSLQFHRFYARPWTLRGQPPCDAQILSILKNSALREAKNRCREAGYEDCDPSESEVLRNGTLWDPAVCRLIGASTIRLPCGQPLHPSGIQALGCVVRATIKGSRN